METTKVLCTLMLAMFMIFNASSLVIKSFNNSLTSEDLIFSGNQNITRYLSIPNSINSLTNGYINLTGCNYQSYDTQNVSNFSSVSVGGVVFNLSYAFDNNWKTFLVMEYGSGIDHTIYWNYTLNGVTEKPLILIMNLTGYNAGETNYTYRMNIPRSCSNSNNLINFKDVEFGTEMGDWFLNHTIYCQNQSDLSSWIAINNFGANYLRSIYETKIETNCPPINVTLKINDKLVLNYTNEFIQKNNKSINLAGYINPFLNSTYLIGTNYIISFIFHSDSASILQYLDLQFDNNGFLENSKTFNSPVIETTNESFSINITYDDSAFSNVYAYLVYNNTEYLGTKSGTTNNLIFTSSLNVPIVSSSGINKSFYWKFGLTNSTATYLFNSSFSNQTINKLTAPTLNYTTCPAATLPAWNFSFATETTMSKLSGLNVSMVFSYALDSSSTLYTINTSYYNVSNVYICIPNSSYYYINYGEIQYTAEGFANRRYYTFSGTRITNQTINTTIYDLDNNLASPFLMTIQSTSLQPYKNYYISSMRWYPEINGYNVVDMGKTDDKGQTTLYFKTFDVDYRLGVYTPAGSLIKMINPMRMVCTTSPCTYIIYIEDTISDLTSAYGIEQSLTWNNNTKTFTYIWNDPSQRTQTMNLSVYQDSGTASNLICSSTSSGTTGILVCDVSAYTGVLRAEAVRTASPATLMEQLIVAIRSSFTDLKGGKTLSLIFTAAILIVSAFVAIFNPLVAVIMSVIGFVLPLFLFGNVSYGFVVFGAVVVLAGIILHFLRRIG